MVQETFNLLKEDKMKKILLTVLLLLMVVVLSACNKIPASTESLFSLAGSLNEDEEGISEVIHYQLENIENSYIVKFENGDMLIVQDDDSFEYHMPISTDYTYSEITIYSENGDLNSVIAQIVVTIENTPSTGEIVNFNVTEEREFFDVTFDSYINSANISEDIATVLFNENAEQLVSRIKDLFQNVFEITFE
jgi:hypothetical protein